MAFVTSKNYLDSDFSSYETDPEYKELEKRIGAEPRDFTLPKEEEDDLEFVKGIKSGFNQTQALGGGLKAAIGSAVGNQEWVDSGLDYYQKQMQEAAQYAPRTAFEDDWGEEGWVDGFTDFTDWLSFTAGNLVPSIAGMIGFGGIGGAVAGGVAKGATTFGVKQSIKKKMEDAAKGIAEKQLLRESQQRYVGLVAKKYAKGGAAAGAFGFSAGAGTGENFGRIYEETGLEDPGAAISLGVAMGALDLVGVPFRAFRKMFPDESMDALKNDLAQAALDERGTIKKMFDRVVTPETRLGSIGAEALKSGVLEGVTEVLQEFLSRTSVKWAAKNLSEEEQEKFEGYMFNEDAMSSYLHAMAAGAVGGKFMGGITGAVAGPSERGKQLRSLREKNNVEEGKDTPSKERTFEEQEQARNKVITEQRAKASEAYEEEQNNPEPVLPESLKILREKTREAMEFEVSPTLDTLTEANSSNRDEQQEILDVMEERGEIFVDRTGAVPTYQIFKENTEVETEALVVEDPYAGLTGMDRELARFNDPDQETDTTVSATINQNPQGFESAIPVAGSLNAQEDSITDLVSEINEEQGEVTQPNGSDTIVRRGMVTFQDLVQKLTATRSTAPKNKVGGNKGVGDLTGLADFVGANDVESSPELKAVASVLVEAVRRGLPREAIDSLAGFYGFEGGAPDANNPSYVPASYSQSTNTIVINRWDMEQAASSSGKKKDLLFEITHELFHALDADKGFTSEMKGMGVTISRVDGELTMDLDTFTAEMHAAYAADNELGKVFNYPFDTIANYLENRVDGNLELGAKMLRQELFAQAGAVFTNSPKLLKKFAPQTYKMMQDIQSDARSLTERRDASEAQSQDTTVRERDDLQGDVRTPPVDRGDEAPDTGESGLNSEEGGGGEQADTGVERQGDDQDGNQDGRPLSVREQFEDQQDLDEIPPVENRNEVEGDTKSQIKGLESIELPVDELSLSQDVPQFKSGANNEGVVEALGGKFDRTGAAPIIVWERNDGRKEIISGRHRWDLAKRSGEKTILSQVVREADGFTVKQAITLDAELNLRDGQGQVKDYVNYFKASGITKEEANLRGLLSRSKGRRAYAIANSGSDELITAHRNDQITDAEAEAVALNAPGNSALQAAGLKALINGSKAIDAVNVMKAVLSVDPNAGGGGQQDSMFSFDDSAMQTAADMAKIVSRKQRQITADLSAITGASKKPEVAKKYGVNVKNAVALKKVIDGLKADRVAWENWHTNPKLVAEINSEMTGDTPSETSVDTPRETQSTGEFEAYAENTQRDIEQFKKDNPKDTTLPVVITITDPNLEPVGGKKKIKKGELYETEGNVEVIFPDGDRYVLFQDYDTKEYSDPEGDIKGFYSTESQDEVIEQLKSYRKRIVEEEDGARLQPKEEAFVNEDNLFAVIDFIEKEFEKGKSVSQDQIREKFKKYNESQFAYLFNDEDAISSFVSEGNWFFDSETTAYFEEPDFQEIVVAKKYLYQRSKGNVSGKPAITKVIHPGNAAKQLPALAELSDRHPNALDAPASWLKFERDLTGNNETLRPPHGLINLYNNMDEWVEVHGRLSEEQISAARDGLKTAQKLGKAYANGEVKPDVTAKLMLWGMMSRMLTASAQEAGFVDMMTTPTGANRNPFEDFVDRSLSGEFTKEDVAEWKKFVPEMIEEGSFGRAGTSNANDFGKFLQKMSVKDDDGVTNLQKLHDLIADRSISSVEVRRQFQGMAQNIGIDNKVFSFLLLMAGREDVVILDRIQLNTMWDAGRYGKLIYDDIADNFNGLHGLARYEALEAALSQKVGELYERLGRGSEGSVGRYHWESWVLNSGQVVAHPTMKGLVADVKGEINPYAFLGAPEGKQNMYRYGAIYARDENSKQYFLYSDSKGEVYRLNKDGFTQFINEIKKPKHGIIPKQFKVSEYDKGFPWYEAEGVNRDNLDTLLYSYAERKANEGEYAVEGTVQSDTPDGTGQELTRPPQKADPDLEKAVQARIDRKITAQELNQIQAEKGRVVQSLTREQAEKIITLPSDAKAVNALTKTNREKAGKPRKETYFNAADIAAGQRIAGRLDIPANNPDKNDLREDEKTSIVTIHEPRPNPNAGAAGKRIGYAKTLRMTNGDFGVNQTAAAGVGTGKKSKSTFATIEGSYVPATDEENLSAFLDAIDDPEWTQVSMNPRRHSNFYRVDDQYPVVSFEDVIQVGNFVVAKNVNKGKQPEVDDFLYMRLESRSNPSIAFNLNDEVLSERQTSSWLTKYFPRKLVASVQDKFERWETVENAMAATLGKDKLSAEESFRDAENLMHSKLQVMLEEFGKEYIEPMALLAKQYGFSADQIGAYLLAKHAPERNAVMKQKEEERKAKAVERIEKDIEESDSPITTATLQNQLEVLEKTPLRFEENGSGVSNDEAAALIRAAEEAGTAAQFEEIASQVYKMLDDMRENMVKKGLLDEESKQDWEETYDFYVPLRGFKEPEDSIVPGGSGARGFSITGPESMKARGRLSLPENPLLMAFKNASEKIIRGEKNTAAQRLLKLVEQFDSTDEKTGWTVYNNKFRPPSADPVKVALDEPMSLDEMQKAKMLKYPTLPRFVQVKRGGQTFFIEFRDPVLNAQLHDANSMTLNTGNVVSDGILKLGRMINNFRRKMIINYNPSWGLVNPMRDVETGLAFLIAEQNKIGGRVKDKELVSKVFIGFPKYARAFYRYERNKEPRNAEEKETRKYIEEYIADGAPTGLATMKDLDELRKDFEKEMGPQPVKIGNVNIPSAIGARTNFRKMFDATIKWVEAFNQSSENAIRL
ncbi:MAG: hypothetical protein CL429_05670, partial [Acidimicrobiaceae bacterium]|nr:hypothetical protein [Acidimicrobiaceae bacterium]